MARRRTHAGRRPDRRLATKLGAGIVIVGLAVVAACESREPAVTDAAITGPDAFAGQVTRIVDGDTFWLTTRDTSIRVWGLDAPERGRPGGSEATAMLTRLIAGQALTCRERDIDRYGRVVGQCFLPDGRDISAAMIASGTATEYCRYSGNHYRTC